MANKIELSGGVLIEGDCLDEMREIEDGSIGMILCDLPYGTTANKWDSVIPFDQLWREYKRVIKPNGAIVLTSQGIFTAKLIMSNESWFRYKFVWVKNYSTGFLNCRRQPLRKHEDICVFYNKAPTYNPVMSAGKPYLKKSKRGVVDSYNNVGRIPTVNDGTRYPNDVLHFSSSKNRGLHATQKPVELGSYLINTFTEKGDIVLDNAFGSGSFLVSAAMEQRRFIGIEKNENVFHKGVKVDCMAIAAERLRGVEKVLF